MCLYRADHTWLYSGDTLFPSLKVTFTQKGGSETSLHSDTSQSLGWSSSFRITLGYLMQGRKEIIVYDIHSLILRSKYRVSLGIGHMEQNCNHYKLRNCSLPKIKIDPNTLSPSSPLPFPHCKCWIRNWV